jgi:hypothetical protein
LGTGVNAPERIRSIPEKCNRTRRAVAWDEHTPGETLTSWRRPEDFVLTALAAAGCKPAWQSFRTATGTAMRVALLKRLDLLEAEFKRRQR